jgi:hypothetical protein
VGYKELFTGARSRMVSSYYREGKKMSDRREGDVLSDIELTCVLLFIPWLLEQSTGENQGAMLKVILNTLRQPVESIAECQ